MRSNKRGISPLIATVLLIGFVIVLGVLFWVFSSDYIRQTLEKGDECNPTDVAQVDISIIDVTPQDRAIEFTLKNEGTITPASYWVRFTNTIEETTESSAKQKKCDPGKECSFFYQGDEVVGVDELEVIPILVVNDRPCTAVSKAVVAEIL